MQTQNNPLLNNQRKLRKLKTCENCRCRYPKEEIENVVTGYHWDYHNEMTDVESMDMCQECRDNLEY